MNRCPVSLPAQRVHELCDAILAVQPRHLHCPDFGTSFCRVDFCLAENCPIRRTLQTLDAFWQADGFGHS